ncbi:MAG: Ig-like domain-containing protein [Deltaproteobacteria bacterium]|nr:Ig-like domain-containing protein [Deltaproteobacteria bacterium]
MHRTPSLFFALVLSIVAWLVSCAIPQQPTLEMSASDSTLVTGGRLRLTVTRQFPGGPLENVTSKVAFTTTDPAVASVVGGEIVAGTQPGPVTIKAADPSSDATAAVTFTVVRPKVVTLDVSPANATVIARGLTQQFRARAIFSDGSEREVTTEVSWTSTNVAAALVGDTPLDKGVVTAVAAGDTSIIATDGATKVQGRTQVFVTGGAPQLKAILVTPNPGIVGVGKTTTFTALGVLSDGTTRDVTREATWSSSRTDLATVDAVGVVTGVAAGDVTITAVGAEPNATIRGSAATKVIP